MAHDCFISYNRMDNRLVQQLSDALEQKGIRAWWDSELRGAVGPWPEHVARALEESQALVVIVSKNSVKSEEVEKEINYARTNKKPVIPVFAGDVPSVGRVYYAVQLDQHVKTAFSSVETPAIEEIVFKLNNIIADPTPPLALTELILRDEEIPPLGNLETALHRACYRHFVQSVKDRDFTEAEQVLQDIRNRHIPVRPPEQLEALQAWSKWLGWYQRAKDNSKTWGDLARALAEKLPSSMTSPIAFRDVCPPVALRLELEWWRIADEVLKRFLRALTTGNWTNAIRSLNSLEPALLNPIMQIVEGAASLNVSSDKSFFSCAHRVLDMYQSAPSESKLTFESLFQASFPPDEHSLFSLRNGCQSRTTRATSLQWFLEMLHSIAAKCGGTDSSAYQLLKTVEASMDTGEAAKDTADFDEILKLRMLWDSSLESIISMDQENERLSKAEEDLFKVGRVFPRAMQQGKTVGAYRLAISNYPEFNGAATTWQETAESLAQCENTVHELLDGLILPLGLYWGKEPAERSQKIKNFSQQLSRQQRQLEWKRETLKALDPLAAGKPEAALGALRNLMHRDSELTPFLEPWVKACEEHRSLLASGCDLRSPVNRNTGLPLALFTGNDAQHIETILSAAERADAALRAAVETGFPFQEITIPTQAIIAYLACLRGVLGNIDRANWHSAERKLTAYVADAPEPPESAWKLLAAIKTLSQVPAFFSIESVLTTAVSKPVGRRATGPPANHSQASLSALLAVLGEIEGVAGSLKSQGDYFPHNLGVTILSTIGRTAKPEPQHLLLAISCCALFACSEKYRELLTQSFAPVALPVLRKGSKLRDSVGAQIRKSFERAGLSWGVISDPQSWACCWEVECFAVRQLSSPESYAPLPWPFGPALIEFFDLRRELEELLQRRPALRIWYGPCAAGVAINFSGDPESALRSLPDAKTCTMEQAKASLGYGVLPNPLKGLQADVNSVRSDVLLLLLNRDRFNPQSPPSEGANIEKNAIAHCMQLLDLRAQGAAVEESFIRALIDVFKRMVEQLERPSLHLRRAATVEDAQARKKCMDGVFKFLSELPEQKWLADCIRTLRSFRSDVNRTLVDLKRGQWEGQGKSSALLIEMQSLAEEATRDDPSDPYAKILRIRTLLLEGPEALSKVEVYLQSVQSSRSILDWPAWAAQEVQRLIRKVADQQE